MPKGTNDKVLAQNRKASHDYTILETIEAGMVLTGTEIKSVRQARINLKDGYVSLKQDYFNFIESHMILLGERTGVSYRIGDRVRVKCVKVDVEAREVDFLLVEDAKLAKTERPRKVERFDDKSSKKGKKSKVRQRFKKAIKTKKKRR